MNAWVNLAIILGLFAGAWACRRIARRIMTRNIKAGDRPLCGKCQFDLSGTLAIDWQGDAKPANLGGICPECGADVSKPGAVVKANDHFVVEALRMPVPVLMIVAAVALIALFRPHQANYSRPLPNSMLVWLLQKDLITSKGRYELFRRLSDGQTFSDAELKQALPAALAAAGSRREAGPDPWGSVIAASAMRGLLGDVALPKEVLGHLRLTSQGAETDRLAAEGDFGTLRLDGVSTIWSPVSVSVSGFPALVCKDFKVPRDAFLVLPDRRVGGMSAQVDVRYRWGLLSMTSNAAPVFDAPVTQTTTTLRAANEARPFVDRTCDPKHPGIVAHSLLVADVLHPNGTRSLQVVGTFLGGGLPDGRFGQPECAAAAAVRISLLGAGGAKFPIATAVLVPPKDEAPEYRQQYSRIYWSLEELPEEGSRLLQANARVQLLIESDQALEQAFLPGGPVWRGSVISSADVVAFGRGDYGQWLGVRYDSAPAR